MIPVSVPLIFPKIVPDNWDTWNNIWNKNKKFIPKIQQTLNSGQVLWVGFDIYVKDNIDTDDITKYKCRNLNCPELFSSFFNNIDEFPMDVYLVRVLQSLAPAAPHFDYATESDRHSLRSILVDSNTKPTWYYKMPDESKVYLQLPEDTNTWYYNDKLVRHGTDYTNGQNKQLIMYRGKIKEDKLDVLLKKSIEKYQNYSLFI